jgi:hypothetical protein
VNKSWTLELSSPLLQIAVAQSSNRAANHLRSGREMHSMTVKNSQRL